MPQILPDSRRFETPVYGTVFAARATVVERLSPGDAILLVPDPPGVDEPSVWVHAQGGDVVGHLAPDINRWMVPAMLAGRRYSARVLAVAEPGTASYRRLMIEVVRADR